MLLNCWLLVGSYNKNEVEEPALWLKQEGLPKLLRKKSNEEYPDCTIYSLS